MQAATTIQSFSVPLTPQGCVVAEASAITPSRAKLLLLAHTCAGDGQTKYDVMPYGLQPYRLGSTRSDEHGGKSLATLAARLLLMLCITPLAVLGALNCPRILVAISGHLQREKRCFCRKRSCCCCPKKACLHRTLKRPLSNSVFCRTAEPNMFTKCRKNNLRHQRQQTALKKPNKARATTQCMVSGTFSPLESENSPQGSKAGGLRVCFVSIRIALT